MTEREPAPTSDGSAELAAKHGQDERIREMAADLAAAAFGWPIQHARAWLRTQAWPDSRWFGAGRRALAAQSVRDDFG